MVRLTESATLVVMFLLTVNVLALNLWVVSRFRSQPGAAATIQSNTAAVLSPPCDETCQQSIVEKLSQITPTQTDIPEQRSPLGNPVQQTPHEWYVPIGSGSTTSKEWVEISGAEVTIDTENYPAIKKVIFEVYLAIPTANGVVSAKLYNVTKQHDVWFSEVSAETEKIQGRQATISLDSGRNLYRIKMKTTMGYQANLTNARLTIITE